MATIRTFTDLKAWQKANILSEKVFAITNVGSFAKDFVLRDQVNAAAGSVADNIAEGFERGGNKEFIFFLSIAKGSLGELKSQLIRAKGRGYIDSQKLAELLQLATEVGRLIGGLMKYLSQSQLRGNKFKNRERSKTRN